MFGPHIAILSVKDIRLAGTTETDLARWSKRAIESSIKQLYGAERWLQSATHIVRSDGKMGLRLPTMSEAIIHRIAVALGSEGKVPFPSMDFGKGFVHVFDDKAFDIILSELDTPADLFRYLDAKVHLLNTASHVHLEGGEEDLLAFYLANGRSFPSPTGIITVGQGIWDDFSSRPEYTARNEANKASKMWDGLIETIARDALAERLELGGSLNDTELALRYMASEDRYQRRILGQAFEDFLHKSATLVRSRLAVSTSGITYVFLATPHGTDRNDRVVELLARCFAARGKILENHTVVGIATEQYTKGKGFSLDVGLFSKPVWTPEDEKALAELQAISPFFKSEVKRAFDEPEYPA